MIFAGKGAGRTGTRTFEHPNRDAWGPRLGFAYRLGNKNAIRGGYGIYYSGVSFDQFMGQPTIGFQASPFAPNPNNGQSPAFYLDNGFPQNLIVRPPFIDPTFANGTAPIAVAKNGLTLPRYQNWSLTVERQITNNMRLDVSYIGNRGTRLTANGGTLGVAANMNDPKVLALGSGVLSADINSPAAIAARITPPYPGFSGDVAQALRPFPQYQNIQWRNVPTGNSIYHALEAVLEHSDQNTFHRAFIHHCAKKVTHCRYPDHVCVSLCLNCDLSTPNGIRIKCDGVNSAIPAGLRQLDFSTV